MALTVPAADPPAYKTAREALTICVHARTGVDRRRKELNKAAQKSISERNTAAKELIAPLAPVEIHLAGELGAEDDRKTRIRVKKEEEERQRITAIQDKISGIRSLVANVAALSADHLEDLTVELNDIKIDPDEYMEFCIEANTAIHEAQVATADAHILRVKLDKEEAARKAEAERLAEEKEKQDEIAANQAAAQKLLDEANDLFIAKQKTARDKINEENWKIQVEKNKLAADKKADREKKDREAFEKQATEEATVKAEWAAAEKIKLSERNRIAKEEAEAAEKERQEALKPDREKLTVFAGFLQRNITYPEMTADDTEAILKNTRIQLHNIGEEIFRELERL